jgi:UTP--glucose-1-phosphate uridylyltransferase
MKAIIPAAGFGTRFFPASKAVPKELLPVGSKPAIQWIVEEALAAGADEVIIVTSPGKGLLREYFSADPLWRSRLAHNEAALRALTQLEAIAERVTFVEQREQLGLGHAVLQAAPRLVNETEAVLILLGDALVLGAKPCACAMVEISAAHGGASVVGLERVPPEKVSRYGIADGCETAAEGVYRLCALVEKPLPQEAPSDLAVAGRYLLAPRIFALLAATQPGHGGEIQLTDAIAALLREQPVYGYRYPGRRCDIGDAAGYRETLFASTE